ncbi:MAG: DUF5050 domain-containing protein [Clostridia bacterium]|nr:DUF5050 domain-containing protein [Clostridia bacterium]
MEKEKRLRLAYCPTCSHALKVAADARKVICPYCGIAVRPTQTQAAPIPKEEDVLADIADVRTALAFVKFFFDSFDWDAWALAHRYTVEQTEQLVSRFLQSACNDAAAWMLAFECIYTPVLKKVQGFSAAINATADLYAQKQKKEAVAYFDSLQQAVNFMQNKSSEITRLLTYYAENAKLFGANETDCAALHEKVQQVQTALTELQLPRAVEEIPAVKTALEATNRAMTERFAEVGIDLEVEYRKIGNQLAQKQLKDAVNALQRFKGYKNTATLLKDVNRCYRFLEILQIAGRLYVEKGNALYALENGKPAAEPIVRGLAKILLTNADRLVYLDIKNKLMQFDLTEKATLEFDRKRTFPEMNTIETDDPCSLYCTYRSKEGKGPKVLARINPETMAESVLLEDVATVYGTGNGILLYTDSHGATFAFSLVNGEVYSVCHNRIELCSFAENCILYTRNAPTADNKNLYVFTLGNTPHERLLASNIYAVCAASGNCVYYTVGNKLQKSLFCADLQSGNCEQLLKIADTVELIDRHYAYATVGDANNRILHRLDTQNHKQTIITDGMRVLYGMHCGRLYYADADSNLCTCLPDGTGKQVLFADVRKMLFMQNGMLYFLAADEIHSFRDEEGALHTKELQSIYSMHADGTLLQKVAHAVADAQCFNDKEIDFFKNAATTDGGTARWMFRYDTKSGETFKLLEYTVGGKKGK